MIKGIYAKINKVMDADLKIIERLHQIGWLRACIEKQDDTLLIEHKEEGVKK